MRSWDLHFVLCQSVPVPPTPHGFFPKVRYKLVGTYEALLLMRRVTITKAPRTPDWCLEWADGGPDTFLDDMGAAITGRQAKPEVEHRDLSVAFVPHRRTCPWADKPVQSQVERGGGCGGLAPAT